MYNSGMELANHWSRVGASAEGVRVARKSDASAITDLLRHAPFSHLHVDWRVPADWLGTDGCVGQDLAQAQDLGRDGFGDSLFGGRPKLDACLAVAADPPPAAWVRVAAVRDALRPTAVLGRMLAMVEESLRSSAVEQLAWLPIDEWPKSWLTDLGFREISAIKGYIKRNAMVPYRPSISGVRIRPVHSDDLDALAEIEVAAFGPIWRHSPLGLTLARQNSISFDVVELDGQLVGFQFSTRSAYGAHLARMTVHPDAQRMGLGTALLAHAIDGYKRMGFRTMTLNTQRENEAAQRLYTRFGFEFTGQGWPIWGLDL